MRLLPQNRIDSCDALVRALVCVRGFRFPPLELSPIKLLLFSRDIYRSIIRKHGIIIYINFLYIILYINLVFFPLFMEIHDRSFRLFSARKRKDWKEGTLVVRWLFVAERYTSNLFCLDGKVAERANFETISGSKVGYLLGEVPLPRSYVVPLLPRRASHCSLVSLTVRKFFLKILLSSVVYRWRFIRGDESDDEAKGGWIDASRVPEGGFYPLGIERRFPSRDDSLLEK